LRECRKSRACHEEQAQDGCHGRHLAASSRKTLLEKCTERLLKYLPSDTLLSPQNKESKHTQPLVSIKYGIRRIVLAVQPFSMTKWSRARVDGLEGEPDLLAHLGSLGGAPPDGLAVPGQQPAGPRDARAQGVRLGLRLRWWPCGQGIVQQLGEASLRTVSAPAGQNRTWIA
jgi:hypothetical protein